MARLTDIMKEEDPCWKGYKQIGMKKKGSKEVPNCVPESVNEEQINELSSDTYKNTVKAALQRGDSKGNSIAVKALQSFGKEIAKELAGKSFEVKGSMKDVTKALYKGSSYSYINQVKMTFTGEGSLIHDNNVRVFGSDEAHFYMKVQFQLPDNIGGFSSDVKFRGYQNNKIPAIIQFSIKGGKVWVWFKAADTDLEFTRAGAREMAKLADTIVAAMDFPTKAKHNTIKQFDAMKPTNESVNEASMSDIDIIAQEAKDFKDFVKEFYTEFKDFPKTKDSLKWLEDIYKGRTKMEGLERVAQGLPQTEEEPISENSLSDLEKKLKSHDWWYAYSDDNRRYKSGETNWFEITKMIKGMKGNKEAEKLWNKYVPKDFNYSFKELSETQLDEGIFKIGVKHIIPLIPTGYAPNDPKYKMDLKVLRNMLNNFYKERGYEKVILPSF
jgi:hypothetical protein